MNKKYYLIVAALFFSLASAGQNPSESALKIADKSYLSNGGTNKVWSERNGYVIIEAENAAGFKSNSGGWQLNAHAKDYTGTGYVTWRGPASWGPETREYDSVSAEKKLSYRVRINTPGTYYAKVRNRHDREDGDNDVWLSVNKGTWGKTYDHDVNRFSFDERGDWAKYKLDTGVYLVELAGRSPNFSADRIVLYKEGIPVEEWGHKYLPESVMERDYELRAKDFNERDSKYYYDTANQSMAIDAMKYKNSFARAVGTFNGKPGTYRLRLEAIGEIDGNSTYKVYVNNKLAGTSQNSVSNMGIDHSASFHHSFDRVMLKPGDKVAVESNTHSSGKVPGEFSRGRWKRLVFTAE